MIAPNESLAAYAHDAWSRWMKHLFDQCIETGDGCYEIQRPEVEQWMRQMNMRYKDLSEDEKENSRAESRKIMEIFIGDDENVVVTPEYY